MIPRILVISILVWAFMHCSNDLIDSGSGSEAGNSKLIGIIVDEDGRPVDNALATLKRKNDSLVNKYTQVINWRVRDTSVYTDFSGKYVFNIPDSGMYCLTIEKYKRLLIFIDSIQVIDTHSIKMPTDTIKEPGTIKGKVLLEDSTGIKQKKIFVYCKELDQYQTEITHGEEFLFTDIPEGTHWIVGKPRSPEFKIGWKSVVVNPGQVIDIGTIILPIVTNYLVNSNVMTEDFKGRTNVPVDETPEYNFNVEIKRVERPKVIIYPEQGIVEDIDAEIKEKTLYLKHENDFPSGKGFGVYLTVYFIDGEKFTIDFISDQQQHFITE